MSSMSTRAVGAQGVGGLEPPERGGLRLGPLPRLLSWLDAFLGWPRELSGEELARRRLLVASCGVLLACDVLFLLFCLPRPELRLPMGLVAAVTGGGYGTALWLLRRGSSARLPAVLLCGALCCGLFMAALRLRDASVGTHAVCMLVPILSVYLLGGRGGMGFTLLMSLGVTLGLPLLTEDRQGVWAQCLFAGIFLWVGWALSGLLVAARDQSQGSMERALRALRDHERKLTSLLDNTEDIVCSVDEQGRLIAANPACADMYKELIGAELEPGAPLFPERTSESLRQRWRECTLQVMGGRRVRFEASPSRLKRPRVLDISVNPVHDASGRVVGMTVFGRDITDRKAAEARLSEMHRSLMDASRQAGMAEIATGVLHNVGNALNSVNVSVNLLSERLHQSRVEGLGKATVLMAEHARDLGAFLTEDPRGRQLPGYLRVLAAQLSGERAELADEVHTLQKSLEHIKFVVNMQQQHARFSGVVERLDVRSLLDDALRLHTVTLERLGVRVRREYAEVPLVMVDRHKLLQVLLNLMGNARQALEEGGGADKCLTLRVERLSPERLRIAVADNGIGIRPEDAPRLFTQGFTTKKDGHGFGLHISALAAAEMDAFLSCASDGVGQGATFTIDLPIAGEESRG